MWVQIMHTFYKSSFDFLDVYIYIMIWKLEIILKENSI